MCIRDRDVVEPHVAPYDVVEFGGSRPRHLEAHHSRLPRGDPFGCLIGRRFEAAVVGGGCPRRSGRLLETVELLGGRERVVGVTIVGEFARHLPVAVVPVRLAVGAVGSAACKSLVPVEAEPCLLYTSPSPRDRTRSRM